MRSQFAFISILSLWTLALGKSNVNKTWINRKGKVFSLFNIVHFKNEGCRSSQASSGTSTFRNGTCYTSSECANKRGSASGGCAAGFGVCCVFLTTTSGSIINQNCSYIQNPGFPSGISTSTGAITYTINRQCNSVCRIRLDFDQLALNGLQVPLVGGVATPPAICQDTFAVTLNNNGPQIPIICGINTGQHMYLDVGPGNSNTATLTFTLLATSSANRAWDIKVTQVPCSARSAPPNDCLQYYEGLTGRFSTFNFDSGTTASYLPNQHYSACIRQEEGFCCIQYMQCLANSFVLPAAGTIGAPDTAAQHDTFCVVAAAAAAMPTAYLGIAGSSGNCVPGINSDLTSIYCGSKLSQPANALVPMAICDCTSPFRLDFFSTTVLAVTGRTGVCVTWMQIPCN